MNALSNQVYRAYNSVLLNLTGIPDQLTTHGVHGRECALDPSMFGAANILERRICKWKIEYITGG